MSAASSPEGLLRSVSTSACYLLLSKWSNSNVVKLRRGVRLTETHGVCGDELEMRSEISSVHQEMPRGF